MIKFLVTSGGTKVKIDEVRSITNMSKGTFGSKIGYAVHQENPHNHLSFLMAKGSKFPEDFDYDVIQYETFDEYAEKLDQQLQLHPDIVILAAAVSDYGVENYVNGKIRSQEDLVIRLKPLPKLISTVREKCPEAIICGFKLLVNSTGNELLRDCVDSIKKNRLNLIVGNDLRDIKNNNHKLLIVENDTMYIELNTQYRSYSDWQHYWYEQKDTDLASVVVKRCLIHYGIKKEYNK